MATTISRRGALDAARAGGEAFRNGKTTGDCPHLTGTDLGDRFLAHYWMRGFRSAAEAQPAT